MIITLSSGKSFLTIPHAEIAMLEDNLSINDIRKVLENATPKVSESSQRDIYIHNNIAVIVEGQDIITVYRTKKRK